MLHSLSCALVEINFAFSGTQGNGPVTLIDEEVELFEAKLRVEIDHGCRPN